MFKRNHRRSDTDLRARRSLETTRALSYARSSEQIPRPPHPSSTFPLEASKSVSNLPPLGHETKLIPRFNMLRLMNASDSALGGSGGGVRDLDPPPMPSGAPPFIITTAPTVDLSMQTPLKRSETRRLWKSKTPEKQTLEKQTQALSTPFGVPSQVSSRRSSFSTRRTGEGGSRNSSSIRMSRVTFDEPERPQTITANGLLNEPPPYEDQNSTLPIPGPRLSESSRSTASSGEHIAYATTTTTHTTTTTTFWKLPGRKKKRETSLFPLPVKLPPERHAQSSASDSDLTPQARPNSATTTRSNPSTPSRWTHNPNATMLAATALGISGPAITPLFRSSSSASTHSTHSSPTSLTPRSGQFSRERSSTMSSLDHNRDGPNSGRNSFGGLFGRIRRDSEPVFGGALSRNSSPQPLYGPGSLAVSQEVVTIPERNDDDTPQMYLSKLFEAVSKSVVASLLARSGDAFHQSVLKAYMMTFDFSSNPMDMALRKLLMEVELPSETQQIDRVLQAFADRYHECNPFIYMDSDQAYYVAFSLIMLHTDVFNKSNKHKMQKPDYVKNTSGVLSNEGISHDILECFYHNITYTPFIRMEDEFDINGEKIVPHRPKRGIFNRGNQDAKSIKEPVDPYTLIIDNNLDLLRPTLKDVIQIEDPYSYTGTANCLEMSALHRAFFRSGVLQILSARSRPDAFLSASTTENPDGADPGVVEIKVTKVGILWRKEMKKKRTRSPWHEWGAILTGSQLYFFRNLAWIKNLMNQYEQHHKNGTGTPVIFKPPLEQFKPDAQISTDDAVALLDNSYKKHKNAFAFIRHGGMQEYFIADSESDMNDWLAKLNYAATFRTAGVRMRGVVGGNYEGQRTRGIRRMDSAGGTPGASSVQTPSGEVSILRGGIDVKLAAEISAARREVIEHKIADSEERLATANRQLQTHLRNGRHLMILSPIQPKAREQVVLAAGSLAAKLQWIRMDMWKLRCHRDILALDMEEERKLMRDRTQRNLSVRTLSSANSPVQSVQGSPTMSVTSGGPTPTQANFSSSTSHGEDLSQVTSNTASHKSMASWEVPQSGFDLSTRGSMSSVTPRSPSTSSLIPQRSETTDEKNTETGNSHRPSTPTRSESSFGAEGEKDNEGEEKDKSKDKGKGKEKEKESSNRPKIRKSLQRTLRESQGLGHRRGKSKESSNDDPTGDKKRVSENEVLARASGSFTVHGKKASVITFGSEWQTMSTEDRMRRHKSGPEGESPADTESQSSLISPTRRGSQVVAPRKDDEELVFLPPTHSRRGSHSGHIKKEEELPEVPEAADAAPERLMAKLSGVQDGEKINLTPETSNSSDEHSISIPS